jgi:hypothetical protein
MRDARHMRLISWTLQSGSEQDVSPKNQHSGVRKKRGLPLVDCQLFSKMGFV